MASICAKGCHVPMRVPHQSDGLIFVSVHMLFLKFGFKQDFIFLEDEIFDDSKEFF